MVDVVMVPGFTGSGPGHWQSLWQRARPEYGRVEQADWDRPTPGDWLGTLERFLEARESPVVLVAHSLGAIAVAACGARRCAGSVRGALLVAPVDVEAEAAPGPCRGFAPIALTRLPFPSVVVASTDDAMLSSARARQFSRAWGSRLRWLDSAGHINTASGHGPWPEGLDLLEELLADVETAPAAVQAGDS